MTTPATARNAADDAKNAVDEVMNVATEVSTDAKNAAVRAGNEAAERSVIGLKEASAKAVSLTADTQKSLGENIAKVSQRLQGLSAFNQHNLDAIGRSTEITAKAFKSIGGEVAAYAKQSFEDRVAAAQDISNARTLSELLEKQTSFAQHAFEGWAQQAIRISSIYTAAAKDIAAPIGERFSAGTEEIRTIGR